MRYLIQIFVVIDDIISVADNQNRSRVGIFHTDFIRLGNINFSFGRSAVAGSLHKIGLQGFNAVEICFHLAQRFGLSGGATGRNPKNTAAAAVKINFFISCPSVKSIINTI